MNEYTQKLKAMRVGGQRLADLFVAARPLIVAGANTHDINKFIHDEITRLGDEPSFLGYDGYKFASCISVNEEIVHNTPKADKILQDGDIVTLDIGIKHDGYHTDAAVTYPVGQVSPRVLNLLRGTLASLEAGTAVLKPKVTVGEISQAIEETIYEYDLLPVRRFASHGVGKKLHEPPLIPSFYDKHDSDMKEKLNAGQAVALEPVVTAGDSDEVIGGDWSEKAADGAPVAHYEHTVVVTENGHEILVPIIDFVKTLLSRHSG